MSATTSFFVFLASAILLLHYASAAPYRRSPCLRAYSGIYYLSINGTYNILSLQTDGSCSLTASNELPGSQTSTNPFDQPFGDSLGRWTCNARSNSITFRAYNFNYPTEALPKSNPLFAGKYTMEVSKLDKQNKITGTFTYKYYDPSTTSLVQFANDQVKYDIPTPFDFTGYRVEQFS